MNGYNSIILTRDYGGVKIKLRELMEKNGISRYALARRINVRFEVVDRWYNGNIEKIDLDILARICFTLGCQISDLLEYAPGK